ncbi:Methylated-DNA--protein-cysteine methyltransferase [Anthophora retusa]
MVRFQTMTPEKYKAKHVNFKILYAFHPTPFGDCLIGITNVDKAVVHLAFVDKSKTEAFAELKDNWPLSELIEDSTNETGEIVKKIFSEPVFTNDSISVLLKGTEFQIKVWEALTRVTEGTTITYAEVASNIGNPKAVRAVGNAVMKNNIAYLVPCHRVIGKSSNKYKWGTKVKENILAHERKFLDT